MILHVVNMSLPPHKRHTRIDFGALQAVEHDNQDAADNETSRTLSVPRCDAVAVSQRARSPGNYRTHTVTSGLKRLKLPEALRSRSEPNEFVRDGSPWEKYEKSH